MRLGKEDILKRAGSLSTEEVEIPEWGGSVLVRGMSGKERDSFESGMLRQGPGPGPQLDAANIRARLAVRCVVDDEGERLFTDADAGQVGDLPAAALDRIYEVAARLSGIGDRDVEKMTENFGGNRSAGSSSSSPRNSAKQ